MVKHFYESIPGYFNFQDLYSREVKRASDGAIFVELGTYCGRSYAYLLVEILNSGKKIEALSVDFWKHNHCTFGDAYIKFRDNGVTPWFIEFDTAHAAGLYDNETVDFVFIDADHSYEGVMRDIKAWWPKVKSGGTFAGHDYEKGWPGVVKAVNEFAKSVGLTFTVLGTSWVMGKP